MESDLVLDPGHGGPAAPESPGLSPAMPQPAAQPPSEMMTHFGSIQDQAAARYGKMQEATAKLGKVRVEMDKLAALGDTVTQEDVIKSAGVLVAAGLGAVPVAGILATMPDGGEALQAWVGQQDLGVQHREQQALRALDLTRHEMGVAAMRSLIGHSAERHLAGQAAAQMQPPPPPPGNDLSPTSTQEPPPNG